MASVALLGSGSAGSASSLNVSVTPTTGRLLVPCIMIHSPFNAPTISSVTWNSNSCTNAVSLDGAGGGSFTWLGAGIYYYEVASGATANVTVTLASSATRLFVAVLEVTDYNTGAIVGDTDTLESAVGSPHTLTLTTAADDVVIDVGVSDNQSADRWLQVQSGTTSQYNSDPRPGAGSIGKAVTGSRVATGASTAIGWDFYANDASPFTEVTELLHIAAVIQTAAGGTIVPLLHHTQRMRTR